MTPDLGNELTSSLFKASGHSQESDDDYTKLVSASEKRRHYLRAPAVIMYVAMIHAVPVGSLPSSAGKVWYQRPMARLRATGIDVAIDNRNTDQFSRISIEYLPSLGFLELLLRCLKTQSSQRNSGAPCDRHL